MGERPVLRSQTEISEKTPKIRRGERGEGSEQKQRVERVIILSKKFSFFFHP